jgi:hypothetical protein
MPRLSKAQVHERFAQVEEVVPHIYRDFMAESGFNPNNITLQQFMRVRSAMAAGKPLVHTTTD